MKQLPWTEWYLIVAPLPSISTKTTARRTTMETTASATASATKGKKQMREQEQQERYQNDAQQEQNSSKKNSNAVVRARKATTTYNLSSQAWPAFTGQNLPFSTTCKFMNKSFGKALTSRNGLYEICTGIITNPKFQSKDIQQFNSSTFMSQWWSFPLNDVDVDPEAQDAVENDRSASPWVQGPQGSQIRKEFLELKPIEISQISIMIHLITLTVGLVTNQLTNCLKV